jgi:hypothetical protein
MGNMITILFVTDIESIYNAILPFNVIQLGNIIQSIEIMAAILKLLATSLVHEK